MGRKTLLSFPGSNPLKNRRNIVLTKNRDFSCEDAEIVHSTEELSALLKNDKADSDNIFVIGGAQIYNALYKFCKTAYITKVSADGNADVFIKDLDKEQDWKVGFKKPKLLRKRPRIYLLHLRKQQSRIFFIKMLDIFDKACYIDNSNYY